MRLIMVVAALICAAGIAWCQDVTEAPGGDGPKPYTHLNVNNAPDSFQFAIVSDRTGGMRPGVLEDAVAKLNLLQPEFVLCIGDLVEGNAETAAELDAQWDEFDGIIAPLTMPFFRVPGNHDVSNSESGKQVWARRHGPLYYHFVYRDALFLCLNSDDDALAHFGEDQTRYVEKALAEHAGVKWTFLFFHKPVWTKSKESGWDRIESALAARPYTVFAGHTHEYLKYDRKGRDYFNLGTTGGGQAHAGRVAGEFDHIVWVTFRDGAPAFANLILDGIADKDIRTDTTARLLAPALDGRTIQTSPLRIEGDTFSRGTVRLRIANESDAELEAEGILNANTQVTPSPPKIACRVPARSEQIFDIDVRALSPVPSTELQPLTTSWTLTYPVPARRSVSASIAHMIIADTTYGCSRIAAAPAIDGMLNDWSMPVIRCLKAAQLLPRSDEWRGTGDCSFQFSLAHDDGFVYLSVAVTDDNVMSTAGTRPWDQDSIEVRLDARPEQERAAGKGEDDRKQTKHLYIAVSPGADAANTVRFEEDMLPAGVQAICVNTPEGYAAEIAVPVAYLDRMQGGSWSAFRLNVTVHDSDRATDIGTALWWKQDWSSSENFEGSGTFRRE
ncbi:MAG: metallophosphoesterase [Candidatus Hydrogenedentes bacterium]|nr:metallophosphoesterase [Candidatus Hydrogenedentota bacterium]